MEALGNREACCVPSSLRIFRHFGDRILIIIVDEKRCDVEPFMIDLGFSYFSRCISNALLKNGISVIAFLLHVKTFRFARLLPPTTQFREQLRTFAAGFLSVVAS